MTNAASPDTTINLVGQDGEFLTITEATLADLRALAVLTREPEHVLLAAAVEALRAARLRSAQPRQAALARSRKAAQ